MNDQSEPRKPRYERGELTPLEAVAHLESVRCHAEAMRKKLRRAEKSEQDAAELLRRATSNLPIVFLFDGKNVLEVYYSPPGHRPVIVRHLIDDLATYSNTCHMEVGQ